MKYSIFCIVTEINLSFIVENYFDTPMLNAYSSSIKIVIFNFVHINSKATDLKPRGRKDVPST